MNESHQPENEENRARLSSSPSPSSSWKAHLQNVLPPTVAQEIDMFERDIELRRQNKVEEKLFAETRLRRGAYGQRYDNGQRHDGRETRTIAYPEVATKGPYTLWDAPGMQRIKVPFGGLTPAQLDALAEVSEDYADAVLHVTTRQDIQLHFVHIEDTPDLMRRLAAAGITTKEACGNTVRNVTACPTAGVCRTESFDVTPYAKALAEFLLGHPDAQDFGRKFKISFSGCEGEGCGLAHMHDLGFIARKRPQDAQEQRGFRLLVGGGLGSVPYRAQVFDEFLPEEELLPMAQAVCRVFARLGEKKNRGKARLKFLVAKLGLEEFRRLVLEERAALRPDPRWNDYLAEVRRHREEPGGDREKIVQISRPSTRSAFEGWRVTNVSSQVQAGFSAVTVVLPLGDMTADQARQLSDIARRFVGDNLRTTVEQNILLRWVRDEDLEDLHGALVAAGLASTGAGTITDITACPGTDTCKLGIASSRGLAAELRNIFSARETELSDAVRSLRIKASGCFNSCGQHHVADIGFYGSSRKKGAHVVPHFQVVLGGQWSENASSFGLSVGAIPSKRIPEVVDRITRKFERERQENESFQAFIRRIGKAQVKLLLEDLAEVPAHAIDPSFYSDWHDPREYSMSDYGIGECAGEVVPKIEFALHACERQVFEAQLRLEAKAFEQAAEIAYRAMLGAAKALLERDFVDNLNDHEPEPIVREFKARFYETERFFDPYAGGKFAAYFFRAHALGVQGLDFDEASRRVEEAQLFIEAAHACYERLSREREGLAV